MTGDRELSADAINQYFDPLFRWLINYRKRHGYPVGWGEEDLSAKVLHRKAGKFEPGQGRSGILKTNNKGMSLSINIPSSLTGGKSGATKNNDVGQKGEDEKISIPLIDLAKLLSSGDHFSVTSSETNANSKDGATTISNKEFNLSNDDRSSQDSQNDSKTSKATPNSSGVGGNNETSTEDGGNTPKTKNEGNSTNGANGNSTNGVNGTSTSGVNGTSTDGVNNMLVNGTSEKQSNVTNNSSSSVQNDQSASKFVEGKESNGTVSATNPPSVNATNTTNQADSNVTSPNNETTKHANESLAWQAEALKNGLNTGAVSNATNSTASEQGNSTVTPENALTRHSPPCKRSSTSAGDNIVCDNDLMETISISPGKLIQHVLMKKVKNLVEKTLPQANVEKTNNGFTVNFDLNPKDEIPARVSQVQTSKTRQQHVNVFIAPKGVVVKPKSSEQLMKPSFVPVQNKDNLELRGGK